ncbi:MAG TPA: helix-turn-helix domain-containing protein [Bordetella sp.]
MQEGRPKPPGRENEGARFLTLKLDLIKTEMISRANSAYRELCGLDVRQLRVLRNICSRPGVTASDVVRQSLIEKTLLSKMLAELIQRKLVRRTVHPADARHFQLWPTPAGLHVRDQADVLGGRLEDDMLAPLTPAERESLNQLVNKLMAMFLDDSPRGGPADGKRA